MRNNQIYLLILVLLFPLLYLSCAGDESNRRIMRVNQAPNDKCCAHRNENGTCFHELVPGCSTDGGPLFKTEFLKPDDCCAKWGADGMCYEEVVKGCSGRGEIFYYHKNKYYNKRSRFYRRNKSN